MGGFVVFLGTAVAIVAIIGGIIQRTQERRLLHLERMKALEAGQPVDFDEPNPRRRRSRERNGNNLLVHGIVWTGIGWGLIFAFIGGKIFFPDWGHWGAGGFLMLWGFPAFGVGLGLLLLGLRSRDQEKNRNRTSPPPPGYPQQPPPPGYGQQQTPPGYPPPGPSQGGPEGPSR